jgi:hypothetical protein
MGWISHKFPKNRKIVLLRHPCAVINSIVRSQGSWTFYSHREIMASIGTLSGIKVSSSLSDLKSREQILAALW